MSEVTVCLTSCDRFNLLQQTVDSFFNLNTYPIDRFIITEDSGNSEMKNKILQRYGNKVELVFNEKNLGVCKSIDNMYNLVSTKYIFHCEDDWRFYGNPNFVKDSVSVLDEFIDIHQVWIRSHAAIGKYLEQKMFRSKSGVEFKYVTIPHCGNWGGFSLNPGLRRVSDYKRIFPDGLSKFVVPNEPIVIAEYHCNVQAMKEGYKAVSLINYACDHIGHNQSTYI